jgi:ornithine cyclodeaminase/alanine dehydrogenase-like protein (mu-crystallin family)
VDSIEAALAEAGDLIIPLNNGLVNRDHYSVELGHIVDGSAKGRTSDTEITLFKSVGNAVQDVVVARKAVDGAVAQSIGINFDLG